MSPRQGAEPDEHMTSWEHAIARAQLGVWDWDLVNDTCRYSDSWFDMLGYRPDELVQDSGTWLRLVHPDDREDAVRSGDSHIYGTASHIETELRLRHREGHWVWVLDRGGVVEWDAEGRPTRVVGVQTDITAQKAVEGDLAETNALFRLALDASRTGIWKYDVATALIHWDARTCEVFGVEPEPGGRSPVIWHQALHPQDRAAAEWAHAVPDPGSPSEEKARRVRYRIVRSDGAVRQVETLTRFVREFGAEGCLVGTTRDITEEVAADLALETEKERYRVTLRSIRDAVISTDTDNRVVFTNRAAKTLLGIADAKILGKDMGAVLGALQPAPSELWSRGEGEADYRQYTDAEGERKVIRCTADPITASSGAVLGTVHTFQDVTQDHRRQQELAHAARHDPLTGILNRSAFEEELAGWLAEAPSKPFAVLYLDLDYFKALNDVAGHAAGDEALKAVSQHIRSCLPAGCVAARLGGDEFALLAPAPAHQPIEDLATQLVTAVGKTRIDHRNGSHMLSASVGAAIVRMPDIAPPDALALADDACYTAKSKGRNRWTLFSGDSGLGQPGLTAARIVSDLHDAKREGRLMLYGQELRLTQSPWTPSRAVEVLARLSTREGIPVPPAAFVPAAERFGVAASIDRWVFRTALSRHGEAMRGENGFSMGFNLSAQTLSDPLLWDFVAFTLRETGVSAERVVFEITETAAFTNFEAAERFVSLARGAGCQISLDDFGAGLSSFSYLRKFRVDSIKIDGSFIEQLTADSFDRDIVAAITGIARSLNYSVVAEKVEREEALAVLADLGVTKVQGYLMHRPEPLENLIARAGGDAREDEDVGAS